LLAAEPVHRAAQVGYQRLVGWRTYNGSVLDSRKLAAGGVNVRHDRHVAMVGEAGGYVSHVGPALGDVRHAMELIGHHDRRMRTGSARAGQMGRNRLTIR